MSVGDVTQAAAAQAGVVRWERPVQRKKEAPEVDQVRLSDRGEPGWAPPKNGQSLREQIQQLNEPGGLRWKIGKDIQLNGPDSLPASDDNWYTPSGKDIHLNDEQRGLADDLGAAYKEKTGRKMRVTSGTRNSAETARELYADIRDGKADQMYGQSSSTREYQELREVFTRSQKDADLEGMTGPERESYTQSQMKSTLDQQIAEKRYLSNHLAGKSLDISTLNSSPADVQAMKDLAKERNLPIKDEGDHLHIDLPGSPVVTDPRDTATREEIDGRGSYKNLAKRATGWGES